MALNEIGYLGLYVGGEDGGIRVNASTAVSDEEIHVIEILEDNTTFTVLTGKDQGGTTRDYMTSNNYTGKLWQPGTLIFAPQGGYITTYTADKETRRFKMANTSRKRNEP
jgi:hypothetical protein